MLQHPSSHRLPAALTAALAAVVITMGSATAHADAVPPPPEDCMEGTTGDTCHGGIFCRPRTCTDVSGCNDSELCEERELCIGQIDCTGGWDPEAGPFYSDTVEGSCPGGAPCVEGTCQTVKVCVSPSTSSSSGGTSSGGGTTSGSSGGATVVDQGCGCRVGAPAARLSPWLPLLLMPVFRRAKRRR